MRDFWQEWRRPLQVAGVLAGALLLGAAYLAREPRRLVWRDHGVFWAATETQATFFPESSYVVHLGAHEGATLSVYLTGFYSGGTMALSEGEVREAIADVVRERPDARLEAVAGGVYAPRPAPSVRIELDFWAEGWMRTDIVLSCVTTRQASASGSMATEVIASSRGGHGTRAQLAEHVGRQLETASVARCPNAPAPRSSAVRVESQPVIRPGESARADSGRAAAIDRAMQLGREVTSLTVAPDTLRLAVGDVVNPQRLWRLTATRADGSVALGVTPIFSVEDHTVATIRSEGLRAVGAGVTRVTVRILAADRAAALTAGASAVVHVVVTP